MPPDLTERERLAFKYLAEGKRDRDIAVLMGVTPGCIRWLFSHATERTGAETRCHLLAQLVKEGKV